ncbi:hypothetical protein V5O48_004808 [Marasmius crinis-equi]|uniref:DUF6533 domain-containing protein n=1 Tax=Marasmius crinis-equi TaxID=585013 RepID=A0ABR3FP06_9AGAR
MDSAPETLIGQYSDDPGLNKLVECLHGDQYSSALARSYSMSSSVSVFDLTGLGTFTVASAVLFLYDYILTFSDEIDHVWRTRRLSPTTIAFFFSRYTALATAIITLLPFNRSVEGDRFATILRMVAIIASESIVAIRTWAIWSNSKRMFWILLPIATACLAPTIAIVVVGVKSSRDLTLAPQWMQWKGCTTVLSQIGNVYIVPYSMAMCFETVNLALSLVRILRWRRNIPSMGRASLIDTLYRDGIVYFSWMIVLSLVNIAIIVQTRVTQLRVGGTQLQAGFHSMLATRMILHVAELSTKESAPGPNPPNINRQGALALGTSVCGTSTQFTSIFASEGNPSLYRASGLVVPEIPKVSSKRTLKDSKHHGI